MISVSNTPIIVRPDGSFVIVHNGNPYHVVSRKNDPHNLYDIEEVRAYAESHPDQVTQESLPSQSDIEAQMLKAELAGLDIVIPRCVEDLYTSTKTNPYSPRVSDAIDRKNAIRGILQGIETSKKDKKK